MSLAGQTTCKCTCNLVDLITSLLVWIYMFQVQTSTYKHCPVKTAHGTWYMFKLRLIIPYPCTVEHALTV